MRQRIPQLRKTGLLVVVCAAVVVAVACVFAAPAPALADDCIAHSVDETGKRTYYYTMQDAVNDGCNGKTIVMDDDWTAGYLYNDVAERGLEVPDGKKLTIDMNGHSIKNKYDTNTIVLGKGSELKLISTNKVYFHYVGYDPNDGGEHDYRLDSGGLVTNTSSYGFCGIEVGESAKLTLDGVAVAGCCGANSEPYGAVAMDSHSRLEMLNGASIEHNKSTHSGGGVNAYGKDVAINMSNASISYNRATEKGGGIYFDDDRAALTMNDDSRIEGNSAKAGGGVYVRMTRFSLTSKDGKAYISNNTASASSRINEKFDQSGGGIHIDQVKSYPNVGLIENITVSGNYSAYDGGGIELDQEYITVRGCTIKDNWCKYEGGGIYDCNDDNLLEDCTVTGNACSVDSGGNYEGGGVFVWHSYDLKLKGTCVIRGNTRGKGTGNADDVMLRENWGGSAKAYIKGSLAKGSTVGVRTGYTSDRRVAKNFTPETKDCLFYDLDGYYISYGTDEGGDAWQRHVSKEFSARIDGEEKGRYRQGAAVALVAPVLKGDKVFWYWDTERTTGLNPVGDYIAGDARYNNVLSFKMPQNDVDARAYYVNRAEKAEVRIEAPVAGQALPATAKVRRDDYGFGGRGWVEATVTWHEVVGGEASAAAASGAAKPGTVYSATVRCAGDRGQALYFDASMGWGRVKVTTGDSDQGCVPEAASVDAATGALTVVTQVFRTGGDRDDAAGKTLTVKAVNGGIAAAMDSRAQTASIAALSDSDAEPVRASLGEFEVCWSEDDTEVTVVAPAREGYNFCDWEGVPDGVEYDDAKGYVTIPKDKLEGLSLTAVYTPVVTSAAVGMDAPEAGKPLAATASDVKVACSDAAGTEVSFAELLGADGFKVTWLPAAEAAGYSTSYTALVELAGGAGDLVDVEKVVATGAAVTCNGTAATAAGFTVVDGKLCLALSFAETRAARATGVVQPGTVEVSFEDAAAGDWQLPKTVEVTLENGEAAEGDVEWEAVEGFDADASAAQELKVNGKIAHIAYDGEMDAEGLDLNVSATVKVAAPQKDADDESDDTKKDDDATETKTATKKGTPSTGDVTWGGLAGLLALSAACLAAARLSRRED